jgi:hypothetical protein
MAEDVEVIVVGVAVPVWVMVGAVDVVVGVTPVGVDVGVVEGGTVTAGGTIVETGGVTVGTDVVTGIGLTCVVVAVVVDVLDTTGGNVIGCVPQAVVALVSKSIMS